MRGDRPKNPAALPWALRLLDTLSKLGVPQQIVDETGWRLNLDTLPLDQSPDLVAAHHARNISNLLMPSRAHQSTHAAPDRARHLCHLPKFPSNRPPIPCTLTTPVARPLPPCTRVVISGQVMSAWCSEVMSAWCRQA